MSEPNELPTVVLDEGAMYWVKPRYGDKADLWTVARWEVGCFWGIGGGEISPGTICGPIPPPPVQEEEGGSSVAKSADAPAYGAATSAHCQSEGS